MDDLERFSSHEGEEPTAETAPPGGDPFADFARFYDGDYRHYDVDLQLVLDLAQEVGDPVLELGCGTGRVLLPVAAAGHAVTGLDISPALLDVARRKLAHVPFARNVTLVQGDMRTFTLRQNGFALAYAVSNTLMHLTTQADQLAVLRNTYRHLRPGGYLLLDLFNPDVPRWLEVAGVQELADHWQDEESGTEVLKWCVRRVDLATQRQETTFIYEEIEPDGRTRRTVCPFTLRFLWRSEAELMLQVAGFEVEAVWGDFDAGPHHSDSERLIIWARKL